MGFLFSLVKHFTFMEKKKRVLMPRIKRCTFDKLNYPWGAKQTYPFRTHTYTK